MAGISVGSDTTMRKGSLHSDSLEEDLDENESAGLDGDCQGLRDGSWSERKRGRSGHRWTHLDEESHKVD